MKKRLLHRVNNEAPELSCTHCSGAAGGLNQLTLASEQTSAASAEIESVAWDAFGLTFSFDFYKRQLCQRFIVPIGAAAAVQAMLEPSPERAASLADASPSAFDSLSLNGGENVELRAFGKTGSSLPNGSWYYS